MSDTPLMEFLNHAAVCIDTAIDDCETERPSFALPQLRVAMADVKDAIKSAATLERELSAANARFAELERDSGRFNRIMEIRAAERDHSAKQIEHMARLLASIHMVLYPEIQKIEGGQSLRFMPPNPHDYMQLLSDKIRAIPAELAAIDASKAGP